MAAFSVPGPRTIDAYLARVTAAFPTLVDALDSYLADHDYGNQYTEDSVAASEVAEFGEGMARTPYSTALFAYGSALEHAQALGITLATGVMSMVPFTLGRAILEGGSMARWILDPNLSPRARQARGLICRLEDNESMRVFVRRLGADAVGAETAALDRRPDIEAEAAGLGLEVRLSKRGRLLGVGTENAVSITERVTESLDEGGLYSLASAVAHGRTWGLMQASFMLPKSRGREVQALRKGITPSAAAKLLLGVTDALCLPIWELAQLQGWDGTPVTDTFTAFFTTCGIRMEHWFWVPVLGA